jgi:hypothetical protein
MDRLCRRDGGKRYVHRILVGKPERKRPPRSRRVNNIKIYVGEWEGLA